MALSHLLLLLLLCDRGRRVHRLFRRIMARRWTGIGAANRNLLHWPRGTGVGENTCMGRWRDRLRPRGLALLEFNALVLGGECARKGRVKGRRNRIGWNGGMPLGVYGLVLWAGPPRTIPICTSLRGSRYAIRVPSICR